METEAPQTIDNQIEKFDPKTQEVLKLSIALSKEKSTSVPADRSNFEAIRRAAQIVKEFAERAGLKVIEMLADSDHPFPYIIVQFNHDEAQQPSSQIALVGHIDVVSAQKEEQFEPRIDGDMLIGRGVADMKTAVATQLVWMAEQQAKSGKKPPISLMISCCEENGSIKPHGTAQAIQELRDRHRIEISLAIVGERTGEMESMSELTAHAPICDANRGWRWYSGEGDAMHHISGMNAFRYFAAKIREGRKLVAFNNGINSSERMREQENWRTGFVNPFLGIGPDEDLEGMETSMQVKCVIEGSEKHSAAIDAGETSAAEKLLELEESAMEKFGKNKVRLMNVKIGTAGNYNTVSGGGEIVLLIAAEATEIENWKKEKIDKKEASQIEIQEFNRGMITNVAPIFGLDIREIPEHTGGVNRWIQKTRNELEAAGVELKTINEGDAWVCPQEIEALRILRQAYETVTGIKATSAGKLHGNDGRFFGGNAVVYGQVGINPHGPNEAHYIPSVLTYLKILDRYAELL